jgi:methylaspartate ammonia-lyase
MARSANVRRGCRRYRLLPRRTRSRGPAHQLLLESYVITASREAQIEAFRGLRAAIARQGSAVRIIVDERCNTLDDIRAFADAKAADYAQIKTLDLGGINNAIEAVLYAKSKGMGCCLGGSGNETDQSARITAQIGLACRPDFLLSKPGFGGDEALMIQTNEMLRTLALIEASGTGSGPSAAGS